MSSIRNLASSRWTKPLAAILFLVAGVSHFAEGLLPEPDLTTTPILMQSLGHLNYETATILSELKSEVERVPTPGADANYDFLAANARGKHLAYSVDYLRTAVEQYRGIRPDDADMVDAAVERLVDQLIAVYEAQAVRISSARTAVASTNGDLSFKDQAAAETYKMATLRITEASAAAEREALYINEWIAERLPEE